MKLADKIRSFRRKSSVSYDDKFELALIEQILKNVYHCYADNVDLDRFSDQEGRNRPLDELIAGDVGRYRKLLTYFDGFSRLYTRLEDRASKDLLVEIVAYLLLGKERVKLSLNTPDYWEKRKHIQSLSKGNDKIPIEFRNWRLSRFELTEIGFPLEVYATVLGILTVFALKQYEYGKGRLRIGANRGDIVIDGGGCWGDTALYFAHEVGERGRVYTFEFVPSNVEIMERNLGLNPRLKDRITIVKNALWETSGKTLYCTDRGSSSRVGERKESKDDIAVRTISIDDLVKANGITRIDLIKMDIEGAELAALKGAEETLKRLRPKLAISLYHDLKDFAGIPDFLLNLDLEYKMYLNHFTIFNEETVLYAISR